MSCNCSACYVSTPYGLASSVPGANFVSASAGNRITGDGVNYGSLSPPWMSQAITNFSLLSTIRSFWPTGRWRLPPFPSLPLSCSSAPASRAQGCDAGGRSAPKVSGSRKNSAGVNAVSIKSNLASRGATRIARRQVFLHLWRRRLLPVGNARDCNAALVKSHTTQSQ